MRNLFSALMITGLFASVAQAARPLTMTEFLINKDSQNEYGIYYYGSESTESLCLGSNSALTFGTYEVAQKFDDMTDGLYKCQGKFVHLDYSRQVQIFDISSCETMDPVVTRANCPATQN